MSWWAPKQPASIPRIGLSIDDDDNTDVDVTPPSSPHIRPRALTSSAPMSEPVVWKGVDWSRTYSSDEESSSHCSSGIRHHASEPSLESLEHSAPILTYPPPTQRQRRTHLDVMSIEDDQQQHHHHHYPTTRQSTVRRPMVTSFRLVGVLFLLATYTIFGLSSPQELAEEQKLALLQRHPMAMKPSSSLRLIPAKQHTAVALTFRADVQRFYQQSAFYYTKTPYVVVLLGVVLWAVREQRRQGQSLLEM